MESSYYGRTNHRKMRALLAKLPMAQEEGERLRQEAWDYEQAPKTLSIQGLTFYIFTRIYQFQRGRETIHLGLLSDGTIHYRKYRHDGRPPPDAAPHENYIQIDNLWSREYQTFVNITFLQQVLKARLSPYQLTIAMAHHRGTEARLKPILREHLSTTLTKALKLFLKETDPQQFDPEDPAGLFNHITLYHLFNEYHYLPLQRSRELRDEVAAKFAFTYDPVRAVFFKRNVAHELVVDSSGNVSIDSQSVCITFKSPTTLPTDDVVACKFFALADPALRRQIATLAPYQLFLEELFHETRENRNREIPERERS